MTSAVIAALVAALSPSAADRLMASGTPIPPGARVALVVEADRAELAVPPAGRLASAGAAVTIVVAAPDGSAESAALMLKRTLTELRTAAPNALLGVSGSFSRLRTLADFGLLAYLDVAVVRPEPADRRAVDRLAADVATWTADRLHVEDNEAELREIARGRGGADAVLVSADSEARLAWLIVASSTLNAAADATEPSDVSEAVTVVGHRTLSADEIVARHQAQAARQRRLVRSLVSIGRLRVTFEAPGFSAPVVIDTQSERFEAGGTVEIAERHIRINGLDFAGNHSPRLPIIEPERVSTPPLAIALTNAYRYRLESVLWHEASASSERRRLYVISFQPRAGGASLYRGRAWIDAATFALVRLHATQTELHGPIVSSEQIDDYEPVDGAWLVARSDVRQLYEGAGHRTPIRRVLTNDRHEINPPDFDSRRLAAHGSDAVMLRDTPEGYVYLRKHGNDRSPEIGRTSIDRATRVSTAIAGVLVDPNISQPLPFAGLNYSDFDLFGTGAQLTAFFGGTYGQAAWSLPSLGGSAWRLAGSGSAVLARYHDRAFVAGREVYAENILQRPAHADVFLVRPLTPRLSLRVGYDLSYTAFDRAESTAPTFELPASQWAHALRLELQTQRAGWSFGAWWSPAARMGWRGWGTQAAEGAQGADFLKWGLTAGRTVLLSRALVARVEAAWMDGRDLDRFSRYAFGTFENRLKGYPAASVRFERGGVARTGVAWHLSPGIRLDGFFDAAAVRDRTLDRRTHAYTGLGAAVEAPLPLGLLGGIEWGYGVQGINADGSRGTHVLRVTAVKIF
jgi:hypothetical protein